MATKRRDPGFLKDRQASAAVEFALVVPFLMTALLSAIDAYGLFQAYGRTMAAAYTIADLTAQTTTQTTASLQSIVAAGQQILTPLPSTLGTLSVSIANVGYDPKTGNPILLWQYLAGGGAPVNITLAQGLGSPGDSVIETTLVYQYQPILGVILATPVFSSTAFSRPRISALISFSN